jgi:3-oxoadipate enol-lactonase
MSIQMKGAACAAASGKIAAVGLAAARRPLIVYQYTCMARKVLPVNKWFEPMRRVSGGLSYTLEGSGQPIVLIHGVGADLGSWDAVCQDLSGDFSLLRMDLRGHGQSSQIRAPYSIEKFASDAIAVMDAAGIHKAHLAGFSLGGLIGQSLAIDWPDRFEKIALISAVAGRTAEERSRVTSRLGLIRENGIEAVTGAARDRWFSENFVRANPQAIERRITELLANDKDSYLETYRVFGETELVDRLHEIRHRTLVMTGENDQGSNPRMAQTMKDKIPDAELKILPNLKHSVLVEAPHEISRHLRVFFKS